MSARTLLRCVYQDAPACWIGKEGSFLLVNHYGLRMENIELTAWEEKIRQQMTYEGWTEHYNDNDCICFHQFDYKGDKWIRNYCKKNKSFVHYNGNLMIKLISTEKPS